MVKLVVSRTSIVVGAVVSVFVLIVVAVSVFWNRMVALRAIHGRKRAKYFRIDAMIVQDVSIIIVPKLQNLFITGAFLQESDFEIVTVGGPTNELSHEKETNRKRIWESCHTEG